MKSSIHAAIATLALALAGVAAAAEGPAAEGPAAEGPAAEGPAAEGPAVEAPALESFVLGDGLEVLACPDEAAPLALVHLVFRAGAESLDADSAGSLALLERLVLRGLRERRGEGGSEPLEWEGYVTAESLGFRAALPSSELDEALAALASVLVSPPLGSPALEEEKEAAIAAIRAEPSDPDAVYEAALTRRLFAKYPWRRDPAGSEKAVRAAGPASLGRLAAAWLAPGNAALVIGGDVDVETLASVAASRFAEWKDGPEARATAPVHPRPGVSRPTWIVYPDSSMPEGIFSVELRYRGPDIAREGAASVAADLWSSLVSDPEGRLKSSVLKEVGKPASKDGMSAAYLSQREGGTISISAMFRVDPASPAADRARAFKERVRGFELTDMRSDPSYFAPSAYEAARARLAALRDAEADDIALRVADLAFWWSVAPTDFYRNYPAALSAVGPKAIASFLDAYIMKNLEVVAVRMNPADYGRERASLSGAGFETVTAANAFWWPK